MAKKNNMKKMDEKKKVKTPHSSPITALKSLYSNQAAIDGRNLAWYWVLILFILSLFLPWIPLLNSGYKSDFGAFLTASRNNEIDTGFKALIQSEYFKEIKIKNQDGNYSLDLTGLDNEAYYSESQYGNEYNGVNEKALYKGSYNDVVGTASTAIKNPTGLKYTYFYDVILTENSGQIKPSDPTSSSSDSNYENDGYSRYLMAYYFPEISSATENYGVYLSDFIVSVILNFDITNKAQNYPHSFMILTQDTINVSSYPIKAAKENTNASSTYSGMIEHAFGKESVADGTSLHSYLFREDANLNGAIDNLKAFFHQAAWSYGINSVWMNIATVTIIYVVSVLIGAVAMLILHKRKNSVIRDVNFWHCIVETILLMTTASALSMVFGFFMQMYAYMALCMVGLIRIFFSSNRLIPPPSSSNNNKPLYQARS